MGFFKVNKSVEAVKESGESNFIKFSGFYDVTIKYVWVTRTEKGARVINMVIDYNNTQQFLFNAIRLDNNDGTPNFEADKFNKLCIILDVEPDDTTTMSIPVGKGKAMEEKEVLLEFEDKEVTLLLRNVYSKYNDKIYKKLAIYNIYRTSDKATAPEIINNSTNMGAKFHKDSEKEIVDVLKDGVTQEDIDTYNKQEAEKFGNKSSTEESTTTETESIFG